MLAAFDQDEQTEVVLMILQNGESGVDAIVEQIEKSGKKPLLAVIAGHTTPLNDYLSSAVSDAASTTDIADVLQKAGVKIIE